MTTVEAHDTRVNRMTTEFDAALERFLARLDRAGDAGERQPAGGGWSPAQVAFHVSLVNEAFAGLLSGAIKGTEPAPPGWVERDWTLVAASVAPKLTAPERARPPEHVSMTEALSRLRASGDRVRKALADLTAERGRGFVLRSPVVGEISVYQIGEWATAHVIRHNAQVKRLLGG
jgi:hypothetical protein